MIAQLLQDAVQARRDNRPEEAKKNLLAAISLCREAGLELDLAVALRELGEAERSLRDGNAAREHYEEAVTIYRKLGGSPLRLAHTVRHLGDVYYAGGHPELAEACFIEALGLYGKQKEAPPLDVANAIRSLAVLRTEAGELNQAAELWRDARDLYTIVGIAEGVAECSRRLADQQ